MVEQWVVPLENGRIGQERSNWTTCEAPGRQERTNWTAWGGTKGLIGQPGMHLAGKNHLHRLGGTRETKKDQLDNLGGRKGPIAQPGRH